MSDQDSSFDTHIVILYDILCCMAYVIKCHRMAYYDILWHMPYDIKCHKVCQYGYQMNRLDQTNWSRGFESFWQVQFFSEIAKNWNNKISFVFLGKFLCILKVPGATAKWWSIFLKIFVCTQWVTCHSRKKVRGDLRR